MTVSATRMLDQGDRIFQGGQLLLKWVCLTTEKGSTLKGNNYCNFEHICFMFLFFGSQSNPF